MWAGGWAALSDEEWRAAGVVAGSWAVPSGWGWENAEAVFRAGDTAVSFWTNAVGGLMLDESLGSGGPSSAWFPLYEAMVDGRVRVEVRDPEVVEGVETRWWVRLLAKPDGRQVAVAGRASLRDALWALAEVTDPRPVRARGRGSLAVAVVGDVAEGFRFVGPFPSDVEARRWLEGAWSGEEQVGSVCVLEDPDGWR